jgi:hypothetical protein
MPREKISKEQYAEQIVHEHKLLLGKFEKWKADALDIRDFILPKTGQFEEIDEPNGGDSQYDLILDNTGTKALRVLGAGMHGGMTSPARPWFRLSLKDEELMEIPSVKDYIYDIQKQMYAVLAKSNFYDAVHNIYEEEAGYGSACLLEYEDEEDVVRFYPLTCGEYLFSESARRVVNGIWRTMRMTAHQLAEEFGIENLPKEVRDEISRENDRKFSDPFKFFQVIHVIRKRGWYDPSKMTADEMPIESTYVMKNIRHGKHSILAERGFREWPAATPRWRQKGSDVYGRGVGHEILGHVKQLQEMTHDKLIASAKLVDPPLKAPAGLKRAVSIGAGEGTFGDDIEKFMPLFEIGTAFREFREDINDIRMEIMKGSYNDLFLMLADQRPGVTATEIVERHEEKLLQLGPVIERQFTELLSPVIERTFAIMSRSGMIADPPEELIEWQNALGKPVEMKIEYISLLAQAQKQAITTAIRATVGFAGEMAALDPSAWDAINPEEAVSQFGDAVGIPPKVLRSKQEIEEIRRIRMEQQQRQQQMEQELAAVEAAKGLGQAKTDGTALGDVMNEAGGWEVEA